MLVKLLRQTVTLGGGLLTGAGLLGAMVVSPPIPEPTHADAVVLLSGDGDRLPGALRLMERGVARTLVFVGTPDTLPVVDLCREPQPFEVVCLRPQPDNTRTEAQATGRLAVARDWDSMVVVTSRYHLTRARLYFRRCFSGTVEAVGDYPRHGREFSRRQIVHEWVGLLQASFLTRGC